MHSVSSEQAFLETYFLVLSQFGFDKAKELAVSLIISKVLARFQLKIERIMQAMSPMSASLGTKGGFSFFSQEGWKIFRWGASHMPYAVLDASGGARLRSMTTKTYSDIEQNSQNS